MVRLCVCSEKGGVGKTSSTVNLAAALTRHGRVLAVDVDPQGTMTRMLGVSVEPGQPTLGDLLVEQPADVRDVIRPSPWAHLDVLPSTRAQLAAASTRMILEPAGERYLADVLASVDGEYQWVIMDTQPSLDRLPLAALIAADYAVGVFESTIEALEGLSATIGFLERLRARKLSDAVMIGLINNMVDAQLNLTKAANSLGDELPVPVLEPRIPRRVKVREAAAMHMPVREAYPNSEIAQLFDDLADSVVAAIATHQGKES